MEVNSLSLFSGCKGSRRSVSASVEVSRSRRSVLKTRGDRRRGDSSIYPSIHPSLPPFIRPSPSLSVRPSLNPSIIKCSTIRQKQVFFSHCCRKWKKKIIPDPLLSQQIRLDGT